MVGENSGVGAWFTAFDPFPFPAMSAVSETLLVSVFEFNLRTERQTTQISRLPDCLSAHGGFEHDQDAHGREPGQHVAIGQRVDELHRRPPDAMRG